MTIHCAWELQQAVFAALDSDTTLSGMVSGVFDFVPQDAEYPYVTIGDMRSSDLSTKTTSGAEVDVTINVYTRSKGSKANLDILARINELLHDADLTLATCTLVNLRFVSSEVTRRSDGFTYQGVVRFRAVVQV